MSSPVAVADANQWDALASPQEDEGKHQSSSRRFGKDDIKESAYQAREGVKTRLGDLKQQALHLKEQVLANPTVKKGIEAAKEKAGYSKDQSNDEIVEDVKEKAGEEWETVKRRGGKQLKQAAEKVDAKLDEKLTPEQRQKLNKAARTAKAGAVEARQQARGFSAQLVDTYLAGPTLRPLKSFLQRNNLQLPFVLLTAFFTLWMGLALIRLVTSFATPSVPEFDIHSKEATQAWLKYHAGEYKGKALDMKESLAVKSAAFLASHGFDWAKGHVLDAKNQALDLKDQALDSAINWRDIGINKLGLSEPTWGEWAWAKLTGRPITWQERVQHVLDLAQAGINRADVLASSRSFLAKVKDFVSPHEPTLAEKASAGIDSIKARIPGLHEETLLEKVQDGLHSLRSHLPGGESVEAARQRVIDATTPSTLDKLKSGATYLKNRVVHGAEEASHIAEDGAKRLADEARYKAGL